MSKLMMSQTDKLIITMYILPNISKSKCDETVKSGLLIEYSVRMVFLQESAGANLGHFLMLAY